MANRKYIQLSPADIRWLRILALTGMGTKLNEQCERYDFEMNTRILNALKELCEHIDTYAPDGRIVLPYSVQRRG